MHKALPRQLAGSADNDRGSRRWHRKDHRLLGAGDDGGGAYRIAVHRRDLDDHNRDQIKDDYDKIIKFARHIKHPIGKLPFINFRSTRDYGSLERAEVILHRLRRTNAPHSIIEEMEQIRDALAGPSSVKLLDAVMPTDLTTGSEIVVARHDVAVRVLDPIPAYAAEVRTIGKQAFGGPCVIVATQVMLAYSWTFRNAIRDQAVASVVIDEVDRLTSLDFVSHSSLAAEEVETLIASLRDLGFDTDAIEGSLGRFMAAVQVLQRRHRGDHVMITHETAGPARAQAVIDGLYEIARDLSALGEAYAKKDFRGH